MYLTFREDTERTDEWTNRQMNEQVNEHMIEGRDEGMSGLSGTCKSAALAGVQQVLSQLLWKQAHQLALQHPG